MKGMILAAGLGTRLKPWTDTHPKCLALVNGKSLLQRNIQYLQQFNIFEVVVNVHHFSEQVIDAIRHNEGWGSDVVISNESDEVLETGGGLIKAAPFLDTGPFVLLNTDVLTDMNLGNMIKQHLQYLPLATLATTERQTSRYFLFDSNDKLVGWRNVQTGEEKGSGNLIKEFKQRAFSGIHIIDPVIFSLVKRRGKFSMVDVYLDLMNSHDIQSFDHSGCKFIDVGKPESIKKAEALFN